MVAKLPTAPVHRNRLFASLAQAQSTTVTVNSAQGPWQQSLNPSFNYGSDDNDPPTAVSATNGIAFTTGGTLTVTDSSGTVIFIDHYLVRPNPARQKAAGRWEVSGGHVAPQPKSTDASTTSIQFLALLGPRNLNSNRFTTGAPKLARRRSVKKD